MDKHDRYQSMLAHNRSSLVKIVVHGRKPGAIFQSQYDVVCTSMNAGGWQTLIKIGERETKKRHRVVAFRVTCDLISCWWRGKGRCHTSRTLVRINRDVSVIEFEVKCSGSIPLAKSRAQCDGGMSAERNF